MAQTAGAMAAPVAPAPPKVWRRPNERPVEAPRGSPVVSIGLAVAALVLVAVIVVPRLLKPARSADEGATDTVTDTVTETVIDAGVAAAGPTEFSGRLGRCGLKVEPWVDVGVTPTAWAIAAARGQWEGRPAILARLALTIDPAIQSGARMLSARTGGRLEPLAVTTVEGDRVIGFALQSTPMDRPTVRDVAAGLAFDVATPRPCEAAGAEGSCVVGTARCEALVFRVQGLCPAGSVDAAALPGCAFDTLVATDPAVASTTAPSPPATP